MVCRTRSLGRRESLAHTGDRGCLSRAEYQVEILLAVELDEPLGLLLDMEAVALPQRRVGCFTYHLLYTLLLLVNLPQQFLYGRLQLLVTAFGDCLGRVCDLDVGFELFVLKI